MAVVVVDVDVVVVDVVVVDVVDVVDVVVVVVVVVVAKEGTRRGLQEESINRSLVGL